MPGSASRVRSEGDILSDDRVSDRIGRSCGSKRVRIGSSISVGRSFLTSEILSRMSCDACCRSFSKSKMTMMLPKPSVETECISSTPPMAEKASSSGVMSSRSTVLGDAPG
jgi:hypothetical protein